MKDTNGAAVVGLIFLVVFFGGILTLVSLGMAEENRVNQLCLAAGYESSTAYLMPSLGDYCHKTVNCTSVTVPLSQAVREEK